MGTGELLGKPDEMLGGLTCDGLASHPGGVAIFLVASCYRNRDKLRQSWATRLVRLNLCSWDQDLMSDYERFLLDTMIMTMTTTTAAAAAATPTV